MNFFAAMLAIINPIGIWPIWSELTKDARNRTIRSDLALMVILTSFFILILFLVGGKHLLTFFSIDLPVFKVAGGILLLFTGISMVQGSATRLTNRDEEGENAISVAKQRFRKIIVPLAIPALAGPGSITTVILYGTNAKNLLDYFVFGAVILLSFLILFIMFRYSSFLEKKVDNIVFSVFTRIFGIIIASIAIQFMAEGLGEVFPNWLEGASSLEDNKQV
jgi:multiple antibiotic resistance protein